MEKFSVNIPVRYNETDKMGIVHHANYLSYLEIARCNFWEQISYPYIRTEQAGIVFPVRSVALQYLAPCTFGDIVTVKLSIAEFTGATFSFKYQIFKEDKLLVIAESTHAITDVQLHPVNVRNKSPELYQKLTQAATQNK